MSKAHRIGKFLEACTDQVTEPDLELLERLEEVLLGISAPRVIPHQYGWFIDVQHDDPDNLKESLQSITDCGLSAEFLALYQIAASNGCDWINLDKDA